MYKRLRTQPVARVYVVWSSVIFSHVSEMSPFAIIIFARTKMSAFGVSGRRPKIYEVLAEHVLRCSMMSKLASNNTL